MLRPGLSFGIIRGKIHQNADPAHSLALLRARREWPSRRRAAKQRDELSPFQLIDLHSVPPNSHGRIAGYRISEDRSVGNGNVECHPDGLSSKVFSAASG